MIWNQWKKLIIYDKPINNPSWFVPSPWLLSVMSPRGLFCCLFNGQDWKESSPYNSHVFLYIINIICWEYNEHFYIAKKKKSAVNNRKCLKKRKPGAKLNRSNSVLVHSRYKTYYVAYRRKKNTSNIPFQEQSIFFYWSTDPISSSEESLWAGWIGDLCNLFKGFLCV